VVVDAKASDEVADDTFVSLADAEHEAPIKHHIKEYRRRWSLWLYISLPRRVGWRSCYDSSSGLLPILLQL